MDGQSSALIISKPGQLRDGLQTLLQTIPALGSIEQAHDCSTTLKMIANHPTCYPALILLDLDYPEPETLAILRQIKARWPQIRWVALVNDEHEQHAVESIGVDVVLMKGVLATRLITIIEDLLLL